MANKQEFDSIILDCDYWDSDSIETVFLNTTNFYEKIAKILKKGGGFSRSFYKDEADI